MREEITGEVKITKERQDQIAQATKTLAGFTKTLEGVLTQETSQIMEVMLGGAINLGASDIHIEPEEKKTKLRLRVDGVLHDIVVFESKIYNGILSRVKLLSGLKLNIRDKAQDGRFSVFLGEEEIEMRVSTLPSEYGEAIVMRVLDPKSLIEIEQLGLRPDLVVAFEKAISQPNGMIIVTGPTGSGKTTTLYAILKRLRRPEVKIITIEDPIEYHLGGISQSQVNPKKGYDFANGLRAIVRQDPDVILVGEIRDLETASIALQAALTGHLVLSTLHTNDAAGTIVRLQALGEKPVNIAPAISLALAQRLLRRVCKKCLKMEKPTSKELTKIKEGLKSLPKKKLTEFQVPALDENLKIPKPQGCQYCNSTGYKGRAGIYEFFVVDDDIENLILKSPSIVELARRAREKGMITMKEDGFLKVLQGITTVEEVERVTGE